MEFYVHRPIKAAHCFRILKLLGDSLPDSTLRCELIEAPMDHPPTYEAISYTWGGQKPTQVMICDGEQLLVTKNAEAALRRFRPVIEGECRYLWIDSVCINQSREEHVMRERQIQVGNMGRIYSEAYQVLVWLGDGTEVVQDAFEQVINYTSVFAWLSKVAEIAADTRVGGRDQDLLQALDEVNVSRLVDTFVAVPWFKRVWVVQEVALSKRAELTYGAVQISFEALLHFRKIIKDLSKSRSRAHEIVSALDNGFDIHDRAKNYLNNDASNPGSSLAELLEEARFSDSSHAKDKVFALHGLLSSRSANLQSPSYSKPDAQVYWETTKSALSESGGLDILEQVHGLGPTQPMVSWALDWVSFKHPIIPSQGRRGSHLVSQSSKPCFQLKENNTILSTNGVLLDRIVSVSEAVIAHCHEGLGRPKDYIRWSQNVKPFDPLWRTVLEENPQHSPAILRIWNIRALQTFVEFACKELLDSRPEEIEVALFATLLSRDWNTEAAQKDKAGLQAWLQTLMGDATFGKVLKDNNHLEATWMPETISYVRRFPELSCVLQTPEFKIFEAISMYSKLREQHNRIECFYQTIFKTSAGNLGMAPYTITVGDAIAIFAGGRLPMIVRQQGDEDYFRLITPAYVHGIMDGEAWPQTTNCLKEIHLI